MAGLLQYRTPPQLFGIPATSSQNHLALASASSLRCWSGQPIRGPSPCQILTLELDHQSDPGQSRSERTRTAIHFAAEKLFLEHGFEGVSMDRISELSGVTKQTVYSYVGSKEALFLNVVDSMTGSAGDELDNVAPQPLADTSPEQFLTRFAEEQLQIVVTPRLTKLRRMVIGEMTRFPELGAVLHRRGPARSIERLSQAFAQYAKAGALDVKDPRKAATFFNWLIMGEPVNDAMLLGDTSIPDAEGKKAHAKECVRIFMAASQPVEKHQTKHET